MVADVGPRRVAVTLVERLCMPEGRVIPVVVVCTRGTFEPDSTYAVLLR
jgi:hypothetical protein